MSRRLESGGFESARGRSEVHCTGRNTREQPFYVVLALALDFFKSL